MDAFVNHRLQLHPVLGGHKLEHVERFEYGLLQVEVLVGQSELIVLKLRQIQQVIDQIFHHLLRKLEPLKNAFWIFDLELDLLKDGAIVFVQWLGQLLLFQNMLLVLMVLIHNVFYLKLYRLVLFLNVVLLTREILVYFLKLLVNSL